MPADGSTCPQTQVRAPQMGARAPRRGHVSQMGARTPRGGGFVPPDGDTYPQMEGRTPEGVRCHQTGDAAPGVNNDQVSYLHPIM